MPEADPAPAVPLTAERIAERAARSGVSLNDAAAAALADHARLVLERNAELHLTSITDPDAFLERHLGEAFEGAAAVLRDHGAHALEVEGRRLERRPERLKEGARDVVERRGLGVGLGDLGLAERELRPDGLDVGVRGERGLRFRELGLELLIEMEGACAATGATAEAAFWRVQQEVLHAQQEEARREREGGDEE